MDNCVSKNMETQENLLSIMRNLHLTTILKDFVSKNEHHVESKWFIHGTKHYKDNHNQFQNLQHPCRLFYHDGAVHSLGIPFSANRRPRLP